MSKSISVLTITSNDLGISYGPSIHYLELWNSISINHPNINIRGIYPSWTNNPPIIKLEFECKPTRVFGRMIRQVFWDIKASFVLATQSQDIVYIRIASFHLFSLAALALRKTPLCVEINGAAIEDGVSAKRSKLFLMISDFCEKRLIKRASVTFSVTKELTEYAISVNPHAKNIHVENGVSSRFLTQEKESNPLSKPPVCIYVGTYTPWDGAIDIPQIAQEHPTVEFRMVGDGALRKKLEENAPDNVKFLGWRPYDTLPQLYAEADCAIVLYEQIRHASLGASPLKIREYLASRLPIFTSNSVGTEIVEEYGVGARIVEEEYCTAFSQFMKSLNSYQDSYDENYDEIVSKISWRSTADITAKHLFELAQK